MINRRKFLGAGASLSLFPFLGSCKAAGLRENMMADGYEMPLESALHERTFMQWPVSVDVYGRKLLGRVQASIALIANSIAKYEPVVMLVADAHAGMARKLLSANVELWNIPTDDLWCRDSGPTFVKDITGALSIVDL